MRRTESSDEAARADPTKVSLGAPGAAAEGEAYVGMEVMG
jgi:hypothetical protein